MNTNTAHRAMGMIPVVLMLVLVIRKYVPFFIERYSKMCFTLYQRARLHGSSTIKYNGCGGDYDNNDND